MNELRLRTVVEVSRSMATSRPNPQFVSLRRSHTFAGNLQAVPTDPQSALCNLSQQRTERVGSLRGTCDENIPRGGDKRKEVSWSTGHGVIIHDVRRKTKEMRKRMVEGGEPAQ